MPIDFARNLTGADRNAQSDQQLGVVLAFVAGAANAGAFLAVNLYTSHMTGIVSSVADYLVLGDVALALGAIGAVLSFLLGAMTSAMMINYARRRRLRSRYALPLLLEAMLLLVFGVLGAQLSAVTSLFVPSTIGLLCFMMGLQNAVITKVSGAVVRTTHLTGTITDIGIELGKLLYWNRQSGDDPVLADRARLRTLGALVVSFFLGGVMGALCFKSFGYLATIPLAIMLVLLASVPLVDDIRGKGGTGQG